MKVFPLFAFLLLSAVATAQQLDTDVIYLKDGSILKGKIIERMEDGAIKMEMTNGREIIISMREVKQVTIQGIGTNPTDYGGKTAFGFSLFGESNFIGAHFRVRAAEELYLNFSVQPELKLLVNRFNNEGKLGTNIVLGGEGNYFLKRFYKERKQKVRANGLFFNASHALGDYETTRFNAGWCSEYFRLNRFKRGFLLCLGLGYNINHWVDDPLNYAYIKDVSKLQPTPYFRIQWNFFR